MPIDIIRESDLWEEWGAEWPRVRGKKKLVDYPYYWEAQSVLSILHDGHDAVVELSGNGEPDSFTEPQKVRAGICEVLDILYAMDGLGGIRVQTMLYREKCEDCKSPKHYLFFHGIKDG